MSGVVSFVLTLAAILVPAPKNLPQERGFTGQTSAEFQAVFNELTKSGWRLTRIKGYEQDGESRYDTEWRKQEPPRFWVHHGMDRDAYEFRSRQYRADGFTETLKSTWKVQGKEFFFAVWELK